MTLCFSFGYSDVIADDFMVIDSGDGEYHLHGVTLRGPSATPNFASWNRCYALGPNNYVVISPQSISLLVNGQETANVNHGPAIDAWFVPLLFKSHKRWTITVPNIYHDRAKSLWPEIKKHLGLLRATEEDAREILNAMNEWETTSKQTLQWLENKIGEHRMIRDEIDILVSGTCWLVCSHRKSEWVAGAQEKEWGEVRMPRGQTTICLATPIKNGWAIKTRERDWFLRYKDDGTLELQKAILPVGPWTEQDSWIYWRTEHCALPPEGYLISIPDNAVVHDINPYWMIASDISTSELIMIDKTGAIHEKAVLGTNETLKKAAIGNISMLVVSQAHKQVFFSMFTIPDSDLSLLHRKWQMAAFPFDEDSIIDLAAIRGEPDIFAMLLDLYSRPHKWDLCFINTRGEVCCFPFDEKGLARPACFKQRSKNKIVIEVKNINLGTAKIKIEASDNLVQLDMGEGVFLSREMIGFPFSQGISLQQFLESFADL